MTASPTIETPQPEGATEATGAARRPMVLVTGMSGAGMSTVLKVMEDQGYEAVDNLPLRLVRALLAQNDLGDRPLAIGVDSRTRGFTAEALLAKLTRLREREDVDARLLFMECDDEVLRRRFTETRRRHPLAVDRPVSDGIRLERQFLAPVREQADLVIDTSMLSIHDLRRLLVGNLPVDRQRGLYLFVTSFSFRQGVPREADLVFDVRFLDNPHYDPVLRPLTGLDKAVADRVAADPDFPRFFEGLTNLLGPLLPRYNREGKSYLTIAIGCTGGRHRSVFTAESLATWLRAQGFTVGLSHRDLRG